MLAVFFILTFRTFQFFPGMTIVKEAWLVCAFLFLSFPYLYWKARSGWAVSVFELYIIGMIIFIPLLAGISAWREFGQPIIYGVLAQRSIILGAGALAMIYALRKHLINLCDVEKSLLLLAWGTLIIYLLMGAFLDPAQFADAGIGFVGGGNVGEAFFRFDATFIIFGFLYFSFLGLRAQSRRYWLLSLPFAAYLVLTESGRSLLVALLGSFTFFAYRWSSFRRLAVVVPKFFAVGLLFTLFLYATNADFLTNKLGKFSDAFTVATTRQLTEDASANARIIETLIATPYIQKHWLLGNGDISNQWQGGYEAVLGGYFYPSDIGIIGIMFMYGLFGVLLFATQFIFAIRFSRRIPKKIGSLPLLDATKGFLLYLAIHSLVTGKFAHYSEVSFLFIALLGCMAYETRNLLANNDQVVPRV
jgi:uncharacterized membrane protein